ncbi:5-dehydro-2-deoxygluconokinase [Thermogemmatispora tikiterensis]|uniref:5-dehydro-2-deoxygluconokinase n=1 Tax=Thermogemmatispora tikiterensis TaxID=1825093 RepID=A0A328VFX9_9CHLR|nr:5-dehydro-2-deoxygluconokinase [Thermogemmatispora tikiterensis]
MNQTNQKRYSLDLITMGRSSLDLYANDIGVPFVNIRSFAAYVGGCPTNISVGARRLGLHSAVLTAVGDDPVGDFILYFLQQEGVVTTFIPRKPGYRSSAVVLGIEPPDRFPLVYYRARAADLQLTIDDVVVTPIDETRVLLITGTGLSQEPSRSATFFAAERAHEAGVTVVLDLDFRPDQWEEVRAFGINVRAVLPLVDVVIGTEEEIKATILMNPAHLHVGHSQISDAHVEGNLVTASTSLLRRGPKVLVQKRGAAGCRLHLAHEGAPVEQIDVPGFAVTVQNVLGAGDAFAAGLLYGLLQGWEWYQAARFANACGALLVTRHGCANFMPTIAEVQAFIEEQGGF